MKVSLKRINKAVHFQGSNEDGNTVEIDGTEAIGGINAGVRPMQLVLIAAASCSSIDVVSILNKMKQPLDHLVVETEGERYEDRIPKTFKSIHLHYKLFGDLKPEKAEKAVSLSMDKYCSVTKMLEGAVKITYSLEILPPLA